MNWGKGIIIGMAIFMLFIISMGVRMLNSKTDDYDKEYYEKGITFDDDYKKEKQVTTDNAQPRIQITDSHVILKFKESAVGYLRLNRPSDRRLDRQVQFTTNNDGMYKADLKLPAVGRWHIELQWQSKGKSYLYQQQAYLK